MQLLTLSSFSMKEFYNKLRVVIRVLWLLPPLNNVGCLKSTNPTISLPQMNNIMMECDTVIANYPAIANHSTSFRSCLA